MCYLYVESFLHTHVTNIRSSPSVENEVNSENLLSCQCVSHWPRAICRPRRYLVFPRSPNNLSRLSAASNPLAAIIPVAHAGKEREIERVFPMQPASTVIDQRWLSAFVTASNFGAAIPSAEIQWRNDKHLSSIWNYTSNSAAHCRARLEYPRDPAVQVHRDEWDNALTRRVSTRRTFVALLKALPSRVLQRLAIPRRVAWIFTLYP